MNDDKDQKIEMLEAEIDLLRLEFDGLSAVREEIGKILGIEEGFRRWKYIVPEISELKTKRLKTP